jgi:hypothetical protein
MPDGKKPSLPQWGRWKPRLKWLALGAVAVGLLAALGWWYWRSRGERPVYEVYSMVNVAGENPVRTAFAIQEFLTEEFPPDDYQYLGVIAQRLPTSRDPSTTTYVLFKRK